MRTKAVKLEANWSKEYGIVILVERMWQKLGLEEIVDGAISEKSDRGAGEGGFALYGDQPAFRPEEQTLNLQMA